MNKKDLLKQKSIYVVLIVAMVLSLFCLVGMVKPDQQYHFEGSHTFDTGIAVSEAVLYDDISLPAGIYEVRLQYQTDVSFKNLCFVTDPSAKLKTNYEELFKNRGETAFRMWLGGKTDTLRVTVSYGGEGNLTTGSLILQESDALWTRILTILWCITFVLVSALMIRRYDQIKGLSKETKHVILGVLVISALASIPYVHDYMKGGGDLVYHLHRIKGVKDGILSGQFPIRLEPEWLFGHGYANSVLYCNTCLYIPAVLQLLGFTVSEAYNAYCILLNLATAAISCYCFGKIFKSVHIGIICSALYTLSIFRINKMVMVAALGEASAYTFLPLILFGLYRAFTEDVTQKSYKNVWIFITIGYAGILQTHVLSCEIVAFLTIITCIICIKKVLRKETFLELAKGALGALAVSLWYVVPFLDYYLTENLHIRHVAGRTIQERGLYWQQLILPWWRAESRDWLVKVAITDFDTVGLGIILLASLGIFMILWVMGKWKKTQDSVMCLGKYSGMLAVVLILMSLRTFPWDKIQSINGLSAALVSSLQFPSRFLAWGTTCSVTVCGCLLYYLKGIEGKKYFAAAVLCIMTGVCCTNLYLQHCMDQNINSFYVYNEEAMGFGYISGAEYIVEGTDYLHLDFELPVAGENVGIDSYEKQYLDVNVACTNKGNEESYLELPLLHYTGYRAHATSTGKELRTVKGNNNVVRVLIPAGFSDEIQVCFVSPVHWRISEAVTYLWWIYICVAVIKRKRNKNA